MQVNLHLLTEWHNTSAGPNRHVRRAKERERKLG